MNTTEPLFDLLCISISQMLRMYHHGANPTDTIRFFHPSIHARRNKCNKMKGKWQPGPEADRGHSTFTYLLPPGRVDVTVPHLVINLPFHFYFLCSEKESQLCFCLVLCSFHHLPSAAFVGAVNVVTSGEVANLTYGELDINSPSGVLHNPTAPSTSALLLCCPCPGLWRNPVWQL